VCLGAVLLFFIFRIMKVSEISAGINWDLIIFIGVSIGLGGVFSSTGISDWLSGIVVPAIAPLTANPWIFMLVITTILFAWRFIDVAILMPTMAVIVPILPAISEAYAISPLVWLPIFCMAIMAMFMPYQNMWALMSVGLAGERAWTAKHMAIYGTIFFMACLITLCVVTPMYISMGLFG
jgi:di/tricarboxylate transporter